MKTHKHNGLHIVEYEKNGPPLIFIHAFPLCHRMWDKQVEHFKDKFHVILYDVRGLGYSTELESYQYMMENFSDDLISVMDFLNIEKAHVCGLSMGGYIAVRTLVRFPDRFLSVILADTKAERDDDAGLLARYNMFQDVNKHGVVKDFPKKLLNEENYNVDEIRGFVEEMIGWQTKEGVLGAIIALATRTTTLNELAKLNVPGLILVGEDDILTPPAFSERMRDALSNSQMHIISNAGHLTNMENPEEFNKILDTFLSNLD